MPMFPRISGKNAAVFWTCLYPSEPCNCESCGKAVYFEFPQVHIDQLLALLCLSFKAWSDQNIPTCLQTSDSRSVDWQHQYHLGTHQKCNFLSPIPDPPAQRLWGGGGVGLAFHALINPLGDSDAHSRFRTSALDQDWQTMAHRPNPHTFLCPLS